LATIKLNIDNLIKNIDIIKQKVMSVDKISFVLKDNAYGHGIKEISKIIKQENISKVIVKNIKEANILKNDFSFILILGEIPNIKIDSNMHLVINSLEDINKIRKNTNVHLKIDTGMHRHGIAPEDLELAIQNIMINNLNLTGVMTHHKSADILSSEFFWQNRIFENIKKQMLVLCKKFNIKKPIYHSLNSAGLMRCNHTADDMVRIGIALYGYTHLDNSFNIVKLHPVMSLWANKIATKKILAQDSLGYGGTYTAKQDMVVSTYDVGYGDGFFRLDGDKQYNCTNGEAILGKTSMDSMIIESQKDEISIFDDAKDLAKLHNTITYEIVTSLSSNIKKLYIKKNSN